MKKFFAATVLAILLMCSSADAKISPEDSSFAFKTISQKLCEWNCTPLMIKYSGIALDDAENVAYMNELAAAHGFDKKFTACMIFYSDFISPPDDGKISAWNYDSEYKNYSWYFGLYGDEWKLLTWGY